jgi:hypothetical protein
MSSIEPREDTPSPERVQTPVGGIYDLPVVGSPARAARNFFDDMAPGPDDSAGVAAGKNAIRYTAVVAAGIAGAGAAAIIVL